VRWFFLLLLAINVVFYISHRSDARSLATAPVSVNEGRHDISLLSEVGGGIKEKSDIEKIPESAVLPEVVSALNVESDCLLLGPYKSRDELQRDAALVDGAQEFVEIYERGVDFWVYLGPYRSFDAAAKMSAELRVKRVDNFIIRSGELQNAISLGVFTTEERAEIHAKGLRKKKYDVAVRRVAKETERYWMAYTRLDSVNDYRSAKQAMEKNVDNNKRLEKKSCNLIASYRELD
jgi:hypothetical protein